MPSTVPNLIVALDVPDRSTAAGLVEALGDTVLFYKIGYQLAYGGDGLGFGRELIGAGKRVFFDLKLLDISNTVAGAVEAIAETGAAMLTVHAYPQVMEAAAKAARGSELCVLAVTVLTSMDDADLAQAHYSMGVGELVRRRAAEALQAGMGGVVCSPREAAAARQELGPEPAIVTPGIRPRSGNAGDQKRIATPTEALAAGASHLVVGRPITAARDPVAAARAVLAEMDAAARPAA